MNELTHHNFMEPFTIRVFGEPERVRQVLIQLENDISNPKIQVVNGNWSQEEEKNQRFVNMTIASQKDMEATTYERFSVVIPDDMSTSTKDIIKWCKESLEQRDK